MEAAGIADRARAASQSDEQAMERHLLAVKGASILAATELALWHVQPRHAVKARGLERRARVELALIHETLRPEKSSSALRLAAGRQLRRARLAFQAVGGRVMTRAPVIPVAALAAAVGIAAVVILRPVGEPPMAGAPSPSPTREGQVAGGTPESLRLTFDELTAYAAPGPSWKLRGGSGVAEIAPFPDPFDRSLRLATAGGAGRASICRNGLPGIDHVSIDLSADDWRGMSVEVRQGTSVIAISVDEARNLLLRAGRTTNEVTDRFEATGWQRLTVSVDRVQESIEFRAEPRDGYAGVSSEASLPAAWQATTSQNTGVCISTTSSPGEDFYIDNLVISAG